MDQVTLVLVGDADGRQAIKAALRGRRDLQVVGEVGEAQALRLVPRLAADAVVLDCGAEAINGLLALQWLHAQRAAPRLVALGAVGTPAEERLLCELGADVYLAGPDGAALRAALAAPLPAPATIACAA